MTAITLPEMVRTHSLNMMRVKL